MYYKGYGTLYFLKYDSSVMMGGLCWTMKSPPHFVCYLHCTIQYLLAMDQLRFIGNHSRENNLWLSNYICKYLGPCVAAANTFGPQNASSTCKSRSGCTATFFNTLNFFKHDTLLQCSHLFQGLPTTVVSLNHDMGWTALAQMAMNGSTHEPSFLLCSEEKKQCSLQARVHQRKTSWGV